MSFKLLTDPTQLLDLGWSEFVDAHPQGTVFQSPVMYELFSGTKKMKPVVIGVSSKNNGSLAGILLGVVIREMNGMAGYFSSRTVIYGGPLIDPRIGDTKEILQFILSGLIGQVKNQSIFIQFRNFYDQSDYLNIYQDFHFSHRARLNLIVDTSNLETVLKNMSPSRLRQIRKGLGIKRFDDWTIGRLDDLAIGRFARIIEPENIDQVREFYEILYDLYKYKVRKPLPEWSFFERFYHLSKQGKLGIIRLVEYRNTIIGGILSPVTPGKMIYEWYVCGLDQEYRELHPSVLATWAAIDYAIQNHIPAFDFMGVGIPEREYGVREFKKRFGGRLVNYGRSARVNNTLLYFAAESGYNLLALLKKI